MNYVEYNIPPDAELGTQGTFWFERDDLPEVLRDARAKLVRMAVYLKDLVWSDLWRNYSMQQRASAVVAITEGSNPDDGLPFGIIRFCDRGRLESYRALLGQLFVTIGDVGYAEQHVRNVLAGYGLDLEEVLILNEITELDAPHYVDPRAFTVSAGHC